MNPLYQHPRRMRLRQWTQGLGLAGLVAASCAWADEAAIRKNLADRLPTMPKIDEVRTTPIPGLYEVRMGTELLYSDEQGLHIIQGEIVETATRTNLTEERISKLTAIQFDTLPLADAMVIKQGTGARKVAVFSDPNCGYCKRLERDLVNVKDVTIYTFLLPMLGPDSLTKSQDIWCSAKPGQTWRAWMIDGVAPTKNTAKCDTQLLQRNLDMSRKYRIQGTPALVFEDGARAPGAIPLARIEAMLAAASKKS